MGNISHVVGIFAIAQLLGLVKQSRRVVASETFGSSAPVSVIHYEAKCEAELKV
jgi:hypothetical protein